MPEAAAEKETVKVIRFGEEIVPFAKIGSANLPEGLMSNTFIVKGLGRLRFIIERIYPGSNIDTTKVFSNPYLMTAVIEPENFFSLDYLKSWQRKLIVTTNIANRTLYGIPEIDQNNQTLHIDTWSILNLKELEDSRKGEIPGHKPNSLIEEGNQVSRLRFIIDDLVLTTKSSTTHG